MKKQVDCPRCTGHFEADFVGKMGDKWLKCPYCGYKVDVPDAFETSNVEETVLPCGTRRRVETTHRREDLPDGSKTFESRIPLGEGKNAKTLASEVLADLGIPPDIAAKLNEAVGDEIGPNYIISTEPLDLTPEELANSNLKLKGGFVPWESLPEGARAHFDKVIADARKQSSRSGPGKRYSTYAKITETRKTHRNDSSIPFAVPTGTTFPDSHPSSNHDWTIKLLVVVVALLAFNLVCR